MDPDALILARERLSTARSLNVIQRHLWRGIGAVIDSDPFDLILIGGVFDYLPDEWCIGILSQLRNMVVGSHLRTSLLSIHTEPGSRTSQIGSLSTEPKQKFGDS